jgi:membrane protein YdbS with pleckstrin-like domain
MEATGPSPAVQLWAEPAAEEAELTRLDPRYASLLRVNLLLMLLPFLIGAIMLEVAGMPYPGLALAPVALVGGVALVRLPMRRYLARGYHMGADRLRVVRGLWSRVDTVVPFGRVQHLDVEQGPLERLHGLATLTLHTAGTHNASVSLPGLAHETALEMREAIRAHVRRETM